MILQFFQELSKYYDNENDLSNITCAMCNSSMLFREKFIHFFFPQLNVDDIRSIEREVCDDNDMHSRVDFYIRMQNDDKPYLIEVKIYDENHHFGQYEAAYGVSKERLGYITNYYCFEGVDKGYDVKTWDGWIKTLENDVEAIQDPEDVLLFKSYIEYVDKVCGFSNIISSLDFDAENDDNFKSIIKHAMNNAKYSCEPQKNLKESRKYNVVSFYCYPDERNYYGGFCGYIGINGKPVICLGFCKQLQKSKDVYKYLLSNGLPKNEWTDNIIKMKYFSSSTIIIPMSEEKHKQFLQSKNASKQSEIIMGFVNYCFTQINLKFS